MELLGKQNNSYIQLFLGVIYAFDNHIPHDIKAHDFIYTDYDKIHDYLRNIFYNFFSQSPNQTNIKKDINKDF